ncbi:prolipoprotein diacylglyceryl transferase [Oscillospiraceae bacterium WX1]
MHEIPISFPIFGEHFVLNPPRAFTVFGFAIYWYAVLIAAGFVLATLYVLKRRDDFGLTQDDVLDLFIWAVPSGIVGARLYYILFNASDYFGPGKWLNILKFREGGLAVYGGIIAAVLCVWIYSKVKKIPVGVLFDVGALGLLIGQAVGRWGNFINREAYGGLTDLPWKMGLTTTAGTVYVHPTFLYESLWNAIGFVLIHLFSKKYRKYDGQVFLLYAAWYGLGRFMIEGLRTDSLYIQGTDIRVSQLVAALSVAAAVIILVRNQLRKTPRHPLYVNAVSETLHSDDKPKADAAQDKIAKNSRKASLKTKTSDSRQNT